MACPLRADVPSSLPSLVLRGSATISSEEVAAEVSIRHAIQDNINKGGGRFPLSELPSELVDHVLTFLDQGAPSDLQFNNQPASTYTHSDLTSLKNISLVSQKFRALAIPRVFEHVRLDPYSLTSFLAFIDRHNLTPHVKSVVARLQGPCNHLHPAWWARVLNAIPVSTFTIICAPHVFAEIASANIIDNDAWAFNMPYQVLRLRQSRESAKTPISLIDTPSLFAARNWTDLGVNEGSSLKAYTTYEYFLRRTPSLLATLHTRKSVAADIMFAGLKSFSFTAIFPFCNHVDEILECVRKMQNLKILKLKLCPEPESTVLNDEIDEAQGHIDVNDPWNEFDTAYTLVAHTVIFLTVEGPLQELHIDDVKMEGIRESLETSITKRIQQWWTYSGNGLWVRQEDRPN